MGFDFPESKIVFALGRGEALRQAMLFALARKRAKGGAST